MKKYAVVILFMFVSMLVTAQDKPKTEQAKDTVKTEVVEVVSTYAPKVTDAYKIKRKPVLTLSENVARKKLEYNIQSVPVASTFIPKSGVLKGIDVGERERLFDNYVSLGFGNNTTPYVEGYFHNTSAFEYEYGGKLKFISSSDPVQDTPLESGYYNASIDLFMKQEMRNFDWKVGLNAYRNKYNYFGLPSNVPFNEFVLNSIDEGQTHKYYNIFGSIYFPGSYTEELNGSVGYFSDAFESNEFHVDLDGKFAFPLGRFGLFLDDLHVGASINFLSGSFARTYDDPFTELKYSYMTAGVNPSYSFSYENFDVKIGGKAYYSFDTQNQEGQFFPYPDVEINYPIINKFANIYVGASGGLQMNSYKSFTSENPYVAPTLDIAFTNEKINAFGGFRGILSGTFNYNLKASYKIEENKPFFVANEDQSDGIRTTETNGFSYTPYQYGNSFSVVYDNVTTLGFRGELSYDYSRKLSLGLNAEFNVFELENLEEAFNLPQLKADIFARYKEKKWYGGANFYFVGNRKGIQYDEGLATAIDLDAYVDLNLNGGYHFNDLFSVFLKANNITNTNYQRFTNFNAQGFQVLGGIIWKFDSLF